MLSFLKNKTMVQNTANSDVPQLHGAEQTPPIERNGR
jgi:hypothetical protein